MRVAIHIIQIKNIIRHKYTATIRESWCYRYGAPTVELTNMLQELKIMVGKLRKIKSIFFFKSTFA